VAAFINMINMIVLWLAREVCDEMHNRPRKFRCRPALFRLFPGEMRESGTYGIFPGAKCSVFPPPQISGGRSWSAHPNRIACRHEFVLRLRHGGLPAVVVEDEKWRRDQFIGNENRKQMAQDPPPSVSIFHFIFHSLGK
jgi:hypothetical protein